MLDGLFDMVSCQQSSIDELCADVAMLRECLVREGLLKLATPSPDTVKTMRAGPVLRDISALYSEFAENDCVSSWRNSRTDLLQESTPTSAGPAYIPRPFADASIHHTWSDPSSFWSMPKQLVETHDASVGLVSEQGSASGAFSSTGVASEVREPMLFEQVATARSRRDSRHTAQIASSPSAAPSVAEVDAKSVQVQPFVKKANGKQKLQGWIGHPELCARPCVFAAAGTCTQGNECDFCHESHFSRLVHLNKRQRDAVQAMTMEQIVSIVFRHLRLRVTSLALGPDALECIAELEILYPDISAVEPTRKMLQCVTHQNLKSLLTVLRRSSSMEMQSSIARLSEQLRVKMYMQVSAMTP